MKKSYRNIFIIVIVLLSIFLYVGCQKEDNGNQSNEDRESDQVTQVKSEEKLADLKVALVEGQDYVKVDTDIVDFELKDLEGNNIKLSEYSGKVVILNFWATWCPPCRMEMPFMQEIHEEYEDVAILAVNSTTTELRGGKDSKKAKNRVKKYVEKEGYSFPVPLDTDNEVSMAYNSIFPMQGIPTTFIIDKEGTIRYVRPGAFLNRAHMEQFIKLAHE